MTAMAMGWLRHTKLLLLLNSCFILLQGGVDATREDDITFQSPNAVHGFAQDIDPQTVQGACPEYGEYAGHKQCARVRSLLFEDVTDELQPATQ